MVEWEVRGRASLRSERGPNDWEEGDVPSTGRRTVTPAASTSFTLRALDAKPAEGAAFAVKPLLVARAAEDRGNVGACDPNTRKCSAMFSLEDGGGSLRVRSLSAPRVVQGGVTKSTALSVSHGGWRAVVPAGGSASANVPAQGDWTIEEDLAPGEASTPPPTLKVLVEFGCP
jgi:hypothetical protein